MTLLALTNPATGIGTLILVTAAAFVVLCLLASHLRFERLTLLARRGPADDIPSAARFELQLADRLGRGIGAPRPILTILMSAAASAADVRATLGAQIRRSDSLMTLDDSTIGFLLTARRAHAERIAERLTARLRAAAHPGSRSLPLAAGISSYPENGDHARDLVQAARSALERALAQSTPSGVQVAPSRNGGADPREPDHANHDPKGSIDTLSDERLPGVLQRYVARFRKEGRAVSVIYIAVESLPRQSWPSGAASASAGLRQVADLVERETRVQDLVGPLGEAGLVVSMACSCQEARSAAARCVELIRKTNFVSGPNTLRLTAHAGVAGYPDHGGVPRALLEAARVAQRFGAADAAASRIYEKAMDERAPAQPGLDSL